MVGTLVAGRAKFHKVALGGTFDVIHKGHASLLSRAFEIGEIVLIGVVSDELASQLGKQHPVSQFATRTQNLDAFLNERGWKSRAVVTRLDNAHGSTVSDPTIEAIVVTPETAVRAVEINRAREGLGFRPLSVEIVEFVLAEDGLPISTTRIRSSKIDAEGRILHDGFS